MVGRRFISTVRQQFIEQIFYARAGAFTEADTSQPEYQLMWLLKHLFFIINNVYFAESIKTKFFISIRRYKGGMIRDFPSHIGFLFFMTLLNAVQGKQISRNDIGRLVWLVVKLKRWINHLNSHRRQTTNVVAGMPNRFYLETSDLYVKQQHRRRGFLNSINSSSWTLKNSFDFVLTSFVIRNGLNIAS